MRTLFTRSLLFIGTVLALVLLPSCGSGDAGYGVLLWSPDEEILPSGSVVTLVTDSDLSDTYIIETAELSEPLELPRWRVQKFETADAAAVYHEEYERALENTPTLHARAGRNALPMRSAPDTSGTNTIYRFREGEVFKIIGRQPEETNIGGLVSHWYEALSDDGTRGWVFGYTLDLFDPTDPSFVIESQAGQDPLKDLLLSNDWRPVWYVDMIANGTIDLDVFTEEFGFFPDPENNRIRIILPWHSTVFEYEEVISLGSRRYYADGTTLQMTFQRNDELSIQYVYEDREYLQAFQRVDGDIAAFITEEEERRNVVYTRLMGIGPSLRSDNYGQLELFPNGRFQWTGYARLVPTVIPEAAGNSGRIDLGYFLSAPLMQRFDGALALEFDAVSTEVHFAYAIREDGIRFVYIPPEHVEDKLIKEAGQSPLTIFMSSVGG